MRHLSSLLLVVSLLSALALGYLAGNVVPIERKVNADTLIIKDDFLTNPIFYEWWASVSGRVVEKGEDSITVERDGERVVLRIKTSGSPKTDIFRQSSPSEASQPITFAEVSVGSLVRGGVYFARQGETGIAEEADVAVVTTLVIVEE